MRNIIIVTLTAILLVGCGTASKEEQYGAAGAATGAILGALAGDAIGGTGATIIGAGAGAILGGIWGSDIGASMDRADRARMMNTIDKVPTGQTVAWNNPDNGNQYAVTPTKTYVQPASHGGEQFCREVTIDGGKIGGETERVYGTACRQPDGSWKMQ